MHIDNEVFSTNKTDVSLIQMFAFIDMKSL